jgi:hypothetical protein
MKKQTYILIILLAASICGCKKFLDQQPVTTLPTDNFWKTPADASAGIAGIYDGLQAAFNSSHFTEWGDARSDNFNAGGTGANQVTVSLNGVSSLTGSANWGTIFQAIGRANTALKNLPLMTSLDALTKNNDLAQAYASRALMYFWAIRLWGAVPLRTVPYESIDEPTARARTPVDSILNFSILPDLKQALALVDANQTNAFQITKGAILAMLTDVYMWQKDYPNVLTTSAQLIALPYGYKVSANTSALYGNIFLDPVNSKEAIFFLNWNAVQDGPNSNMNIIGSQSHTSNYYIDSSLFLRYESQKTDIRRAVTYDTLLVKQVKPIQQIAKFYPVVPNSTKNLTMPLDVNNQAYFPIYRIADILLLRAEAFNWTGDTASAFSILNSIKTTRKIAAVSSADYPTPSDVEKAILDERQLELFAEGKRWFDLLRTGRTIAVMDPILKARQLQRGNAPIGFGDPRQVLWPIARDVLTRNPLLVQNPPYSE